MPGPTSPRPVTRQCSRPGCSADPVASMSYDHAGAVAYVGRLVAERHPAFYDLCRRHLDALSVPRGWTIKREPLTLAGTDVTDWHEPVRTGDRNAV